MVRLFIATAGIFLLLHRPAYAYLDPGTASIVLQAVVGAVAAAGLYFRSYLYRFFSLFRRTAKDDPKPGSEDNGDRLKHEPADGD
jgi:O-antigen/teichoic acid export membrane protein